MLTCLQNRSARQATRPPSNSQGMLGSSFRPPVGAIWQGDPVKTTIAQQRGIAADVNSRNRMVGEWFASPLLGGID
jgi:hypothetical protein